MMNSHPVLGAQIIAPVTKLAAELPIIRHHHEWYNGSGYPDRLIGDEIPKLARILHVADAFEAMTAARPYRMTPLTKEQALAELRKFAGVQFDPIVRRCLRPHEPRRRRRGPGTRARTAPDPADLAGRRQDDGDACRCDDARTGRAGLIRPSPGRRPYEGPVQRSARRPIGPLRRMMAT